MHIVISGGTGFVGTPLCNRLVKDGHAVTVLTRDPGRARPGMSGQVSAIAWNPHDSGDLCRLPEGTDAVINLAGESIASGRWTVEKKRNIRDSRVSATNWIVTAIEAASPQPSVLINASAIGFYGDRGDESLTESSSAGHGFLTEVVREWESLAQRAASSDVRVALMRLGVVLGPGGGALPQMAMPFRFFAGGPVGSGHQWLSWIHRDDVIEMIVWALTTESARGPINVVAPEPLRNADFSREIGRALHRPSWLPAPAIALRLALGEMADALLLSSARVLPEAALAQGYTFLYPTAHAALEEILR